MKKWVLWSLMVFIFIACSDSGTNPQEEPIPDPVEFYKFDVKTKFVEKMSVTGAKNGLISYIEEAEWCMNKNEGEDYSIWIKNCSRDSVKNKVTITFDFELRTAAFFTEGDLVKSKKMTITYDINANWDDGKGGIDIYELVENLKTVSDIGMIIPGAQGYATVAKTVLGFLDFFMDDGESIYQKAEGVIVGATTYIQLKKWILEIEK